MKIVIVGAGKVGFFLASELVVKGQNVTVVDVRQKACSHIANSLGVETVCADASTVQGLSDVCKDVDILVALTGNDENNLITCQIAKKYYNVPTTISRINNPKNNDIASMFGVDKHFCGTDIIVNLVENEIEFKGMKIVTSFDNTDHVIVEFNLSSNSEACEKKLSEYKFVKDAKVVVITSSDGKTITPQGDTVMHANDNMLMVCRRRYIKDIWEEMVK